MKAFMTVAMVLAMMAACGKKHVDPVKKAPEPVCEATTQPSGPAKGSCLVHQEGGDYCAEYTGSNDVATDTKLCTTFMKGAFTPGPCKAEGAIGRCLTTCGKPGEGVNTFYYGTEATWKGNCEMGGGTFLATKP